MKIKIILKKEDADGLGGTLLTDLGCTRMAANPDCFIAIHSYDPAIIAPADFDFSQWAAKYADHLTDRGIVPLRMAIDTGRATRIQPLYAAVQLMAETIAAMEDDSETTPKAQRKKKFLDILQQPQKLPDGRYCGKAAYQYLSGPTKDKGRRVALEVVLDGPAKLLVKSGQLLVTPLEPKRDDDDLDDDDDDDLDD